MAARLHGDLVAPASMLRAMAWCRAFAAFSLAFNLCFLCVVAPAFAALRRSGVDKGSARRRLVFWVLVNVLVNALQPVGGLLTLSGLGSDELLCDVVQRLNLLLTTVGVWATYWVMVIRAEATLVRSSKLHMLVYWQCRLGMQLGFPVLLAVAIGLAKGRVLFEEGLCTQEVPANVALVFTVLDAGLSVQLLLLFYIPVRQHMRESEGLTDKLKAESALLHAKALRSLKLSLVHMTSSLVVQVIGVVTAARWDDTSQPDVAYWRSVRYTLYGVDVLINTICMLLMTQAWIPRKWQRKRSAETPRTTTLRTTTLRTTTLRVPPDGTTTKVSSSTLAKVVPAVDEASQ